MNDKIFKTLFMFSFVKLLILLICTSCTGNVTDTVKETAGDSTGTLIPHVESLPTDTSDITRRLPSQYEIDSIKNDVLAELTELFDSIENFIRYLMKTDLAKEWSKEDV